MKFIKIGGPGGIVLPDEILDAAKAKAGDEVTVTVTASGIIQIVPQGSTVSEQVDRAREIAQRYQGALRELAK